MKTHPRRRTLAVAACLLVSVASVGTLNLPAAQAGEKIKAEEVVAKHLESIGTAEARAAAKTRVMVGTVVVTFRAPSTGQIGGRAVLASEGNKSMIGMVFPSPNYPKEQVGFDGDEVTVSYASPGVRSTLGDFFITHKEIARQGLLGGALSGAWPLLNLADRKPKLEYGGTKKIGDRQAHEIKYLPRGGTDLRISLFFDTENYRHLRTEYSWLIAAPIGNRPEDSSRQRETRYTMAEDFSDFKPVSGLTLPHDYKISLEISGQRGSFRAEWETKMAQFAFDQRIEPGSFNLNTSAK